MPLALRSLSAACLVFVCILPSASADEGETPIEPNAIVLYSMTWSGDSDRAWSEVRSVAKELGPLLKKSLASDVGAATVLTEKDVDAVLSDEARQEVLDCPDVSLCRAEVGAALGAEYVLAGRVKKRRDIFTVTLDLISTRELQKVRSFSERTRYGQDAVKEAARQSIQRLFDPEAPTKLAIVTVRGKGTLSVDGEAVGDGPGAFRVPAGERKIALKASGRSVAEQHRLFPYLVTTVSSSGVEATGLERFESAEAALRPWYKEWWVWSAGAVIVGGVIAARVTGGSE